MSKKCKSDEVLNPKTNRCVKRDGKLGRQIVAHKSPSKEAPKSPQKKTANRTPKKGEPQTYMERLPGEIRNMVAERRYANYYNFLNELLEEREVGREIADARGSKKRREFFNPIFERYNLGLRLEPDGKGSKWTGQLSRNVSDQAIVALSPYFAQGADYFNALLAKHGVHMRIVRVALDDPDSIRKNYRYEIYTGDPVLSLSKENLIG